MRTRYQSHLLLQRSRINHILYSNVLSVGHKFEIIQVYAQIIIETTDDKSTVLYLFIYSWALTNSLHQTKIVFFLFFIRCHHGSNNVFHRLIANSIEFCFRSWHFIFFGFRSQFTVPSPKWEFWIMYCGCVLPILGRELHICYFPCAIFYACQFNAMANSFISVHFIHDYTLHTRFGVQCSTFSVVRVDCIFLYHAPKLTLFIYYMFDRAIFITSSVFDPWSSVAPLRQTLQTFRLHVRRCSYSQLYRLP